MFETLSDRQQTVLCIKDVLDSNDRVNFRTNKQYTIEFDGGYIFGEGDFCGQMLGCFVTDKWFTEHFVVVNQRIQSKC